MTVDQFSDLLLVRNYKKVQEALDQGFDANTIIDEDKTPLELCSFSDDYRMMEILWKAGAKPTTPWTEEIVKEFEAGKTWQSFMDTNAPEVAANLEDLTDSFTVKKLKFAEGEILKNKNEYVISIPISPFVLDKQTIKTSIELEGIKIDNELENLIGETITFPVNPEPGYIDASMYIRNSHVPVDVTKIKIKKIIKSKAHVDIVADFLFEHEAVGFKNEKLKIGAILTLANK